MEVLVQQLYDLAALTAGKELRHQSDRRLGKDQPVLKLHRKEKCIFLAMLSRFPLKLHYVCIYMYIYVYMYVCMYVCVYVCMYICIVSVYVCVCMYICIMCVCMYVRVYMYILCIMFVCMYVRTYVRMHVCMYVCMYVCNADVLTVYYTSALHKANSLTVSVSYKQFTTYFKRGQRNVSNDELLFRRRQKAVLFHSTQLL